MAWLAPRPADMPGRLLQPRLLRLLPASTRSYSSISERIHVSCGSSQPVTIDLHNVRLLTPTDPLFIYMPPFSTVDEQVASVPSFLRHIPVATINYRWLSTTPPSQFDDSGREAPGRWPQPVHDASFAFAWLAENFTPERNLRRNVYAYGSFLGASLATSLALTESHAHSSFAVRGLVALNGIFNWTMFLPDHPLNRKQSTIQYTQGLPLQLLDEQLPLLFDSPDDLFDPFASSSLFFHNPGLLIPENFGQSAIPAVDQVSAFIQANTGAGQAQPEPETVKQPRKSHLIFPPRKSTLKLPETLLLHDSLPQSPTKKRKTKSKAPKKLSGNSFAAQAAELAELMRRSIEVVELKERSKWDEELKISGDEAEKRIQVIDVGPETSGYEVRESTESLIETWIGGRK